jgi:hypothetical protein
MPNTAQLGACFVNLTIKAKFVAQPVHQVNATEARAYNEYIAFEIVGVVVASALLLGRADVRSEAHDT